MDHTNIDTKRNHRKTPPGDRLHLASTQLSFNDLLTRYSNKFKAGVKYVSVNTLALLYVRFSWDSFTLKRFLYFKEKKMLKDVLHVNADKNKCHC